MAPKKRNKGKKRNSLVKNCESVNDKLGRGEGSAVSGEEQVKTNSESVRAMANLTPEGGEGLKMPSAPLDESPRGALAVILKVIPRDEYETVGEDLRRRIEQVLDEHIEEYLTAKACFETTRVVHDNRVKDLEEQLKNVTGEKDELRTRVDLLSLELEEVNKRLAVTSAQLSKHRDDIQSLEKELEKVRRDRDAAVDEKQLSDSMVERRETELERLRGEVTLLNQELRAAVNAKCEAINLADDVQAKQVELEFREKRFESERTVLNQQIIELTSDLSKANDELSKQRRESTATKISLETKISEKDEENRISKEQIVKMTALSEELEHKIDELTQKLKERSAAEEKLIEGFQQEIKAQTKLAELYKDRYEEAENKSIELAGAVKELQKLLQEASQQCGELEGKLKHAEEESRMTLESKQEAIVALKEELRHANILLEAVKQESSEAAVSRLSPMAASASKLLKSGLTLTQLYTKYAETMQDLVVEKNENQNLKAYLEKIHQEIEEKAPILKKQQEDHNYALNMMETLGQKVDELETEHARLVRVNAEIEATNAFLLRENKRFKSTISDLSRQVCFLLREVEAARGNILPLHGQNGNDDTSRAEEMTSSEVISKHLVTFKDVQELQLNNQKLLVALRELSADRDEIEMGRESERITELKNEIQMAQSRIDDLVEREKCLQKVVEVVKSQRDVYQRQYHQLKRGAGDSSNDVADEGELDATTGTFSPSVTKSSPNKLDAVRKEQQEKDDKNSAILEELRKDFATYRKETKEDKRMLQETIDKLRDDLSVATKSKVELSVKAEFYQEKVKSLCAKVKSQNVELAALEKRCKNYVESNGKLELTVQQLRQEAMSALSKLSVAEVTVNNLKQENQILKDNERRMTKDREFERKSKHGQELVMATLETLRVKFESSETEGRLRLEARLDDVTKECTALRRRLQDEQDRLSRRADLLENQMATAKQRLEEEKSLRAKVVDELELARAQIKERDVQIEQVQEQLSEAIHRSQPVLDRENRIKELETTIKEKETTIAGLMHQLSVARKCQQELSEVSQGVEKQLTEVSEEYDAFKTDTEKKIHEMKKTENELKSTILNLELKLRTSDAEETEIRAHREAELTLLRSRVESLTAELETAKSSVESLSREAREAERQAQEAQDTASQSQLAANTLRCELDESRESLRSVQAELVVVMSERDRHVEAIRLDKESLASKSTSLENKVAECEERIRDLSSVNDMLHDQIQELGSKVAIMDSARSIGETLETSDPSNSGFRESDKFLEVLRLLRKEKRAALAASDSLKSENLRLVSEVEVLRRQLDEAKQSLEIERNSSDAPSMTAERHTQLLAKVETLNQLLENNKALREDREQLTSRLNALQEKMSQLEEKVIDPAKMKISELESKVEQISTENIALKAESQRWRERANELIEKTNKNPEEMKRLLLEKDNLTKQLAAEKDQSRILKSKLEEQIEKLKKDKEDVLVAHVNLEKSLNSAKQELTIAKETGTKATEKVTKLEQDLSAQETSLADIRNKELQIRQIAKKYKQQYQELAKVMEEKNKAGTSAEEAEEKLKSLAEQMTSLESTVENLRRENESLKAGVVEREDRAKSLLKNARSRVQLLTEENKNLSKELAEAKRAKSEGQSTSETSRSIDSRILRLEKEKEEEMEEKERLARELEVVTQRMAIMQRQLDKQQVTSKQMTKPSTSSMEKSSSDPPTANIKPLAGPSTSSSKQTQPQQAVAVNPWRETPFASVRPQLSRTVVVLPTSQTTSTSSIPVLVPPQQQVVHTSSTCEGLSSSPTSSHMDYVPASSSAVHNLHQQSSSGVTVIMAQHMEAEAGGADDSAPAQQAPTHCVQPNQNVLHKAQAFVLPQPAQQQPEQPQAEAVSAENTGVVSASNQEQVSEQSVTASAVVPLYCPWPADDSSGPVASSQGEGTSAGSASAGSGPSGTQSNIPGCSSGITAASSQQAASSTTSVTTSIAPALKRTNPTVDDADSKAHMPAKRSRLVLSGNDSSELLLRSDGLEVEYQVPTSSQRDQEDDILVISDEDELPDDGTMEDGQEFEEVEEEGGSYGMEDYARDAQDMAMPSYEDPDGPSIDERSSSEDYNEVDIDDSNEVPNQSEATRSGSLQPGPSGSAIVEGSSVAMGGEATSSLGSTTSGQEYQSRRRVGHHTIYISHDDAADDSIVPSTPTLFVPRRTDGFAEAVSSPHVPTGRFTFTDSANSSTSRVPVAEVARVPSEAIDDSRMDLGQLDEGTGRSVPTTPSHLSPQEPVGPEIGQSSSQETGEIERREGSSAVHDSTLCEQQDVGSEDNCDGVSSEGEKAQVPSGLTVGPSSSPSDADQDLDELEGREAEASPTAVNRSSTAAPSPSSSSSTSTTTMAAVSIGPGRTGVARRAIRLGARTTSPSSRGGGSSSSGASSGGGGLVSGGSGASATGSTSTTALSTSSGVATARSNPPTPIVWSNEPPSVPLQAIARGTRETVPRRRVEFLAVEENLAEADLPYSLNPLSRGRGVGIGRVEQRPSSGYRGGRPRRGRGQPFHHGSFGPRF